MLLALAIAMLTSACSSNPFPPFPFGDHPDPVDAGTFHTRWPIKHVIFLIKENRTFDHLFGRFPGANGVTFGFDHGERRPLTPATDGWIDEDIKHCYRCSLAAWDGGRMDGFNQSAAADRNAYTQFRPENAPNYWRLAKRYVLSDNFFAAAMGPSFPNHLFTIAAQSGGTHDNPTMSLQKIRERHAATGQRKSWGCDSVEGSYVEVTSSEGVVEKVPPCFDFLTEGDLLDRAGIPWAYYSATNYQNGYLWSAYDAVEHYRDNREKWKQHMFPVDHLVEDIAADRLPPVTWVTPRFELSDHPEYSFCHGENWTSEVVNALMESPMWKDTALFVTWDDYGGFYDHAPPPQVDGFGFGIRVPLLVISPYAKRGYVDHQLGEFSSVLRFIEDNWGLSQLTHRDRDAINLSYVFDFAQTISPPDPLPLRTDCQGPLYPTRPPGLE